MTAEIGSALLIQVQSPRGEWLDVGLLKQSQSRNWFEFVDSYWNRAYRPVLGQVFEEHGRDWEPSAHVALPRWFSHLLPEGRLRDAVSLAADVKSVQEFALLRRLGLDDLPGAVRALPAIVEGIDYAVPPIEVAGDDSDEDPILKFSLAGAQLKYSVFEDERGLTVPARGSAGNVIAKLPDGRPGFDGVPEAELGALQLARDSGLSAASARLVQISDIAGLEKWVEWVGQRPVLAVDRFDRGASDRRVHMEELAQVLDIPTARDGAKYSSANFEMVAVYVAALSGIDVVGQVIDRIVLNILVGNGDAHLKNWAFQYLDGENPSLSPLYDVLPTVLYVGKDDLGLNLDSTKDFEAISFASFDKLGARSGFGVSEARRQAAEAVDRVLENWDVLREYLSRENFNRLNVRLQGLALFRDATT
jgi:serine/threonine-protein kinase HipA